MFKRVGHRRPYEKWERFSVLAVVVVVILAIFFNHAETSNDRRRQASSTATTVKPTTSTTPPTTAIANAPTPDPSLFTIVPSAATDFAGKTLDTSLWSAYSGKGNQGVGTRSPDAIDVANNIMTITARGSVSGGMAQNFGQTYGRWVIRARMDKGAGYGPAILLWPDSEKWPIDKEVDIVELPTGDRDQAIMTAHYGTDNSQQSHTAYGDWSQWHTYAIDWLPDRLTFYIDGVQQWELTDPKTIPTVPHHLAIQNDVGGDCDSFIGCRDADTPDEVSLQVSSVRVFSYTGAGEPTTETSISPSS